MDETTTDKHSLRTPFSATVDRDGNLLVFTMQGDLDVNGAQTLRNLFASHVKDQDGFILFDLSGVPYINSAGLGAFIGFHRHIQMRNGQLMIVNPQNKVRSVFKIASLDMHILFLDSIDEAKRVAAGETMQSEQAEGNP